MVTMRECADEIDRLTAAIPSEVDESGAGGPLRRELSMMRDAGTDLARQIDGWIHHRTNVTLPARRIATYVRDVPGVLAEFRAMLRADGVDV